MMLGATLQKLEVRFVVLKNVIDHLTGRIRFRLEPNLGGDLLNQILVFDVQKRPRPPTARQTVQAVKGPNRQLHRTLEVRGLEFDNLALKNRGRDTRELCRKLDRFPRPKQGIINPLDLMVMNHNRRHVRQVQARLNLGVQNIWNQRIRRVLPVNFVLELAEQTLLIRHSLPSPFT